MREIDPLWARISRIADAQFGHIARRQLLALGVKPSWIASQLRRGRLIAVHAGVYAVGHVPRHAHARARAAVLACEPAAALSHAAAAALWGAGRWPVRMEVVALREHRRPGIETHRTSLLEVRTQHGIRVTTPVRTTLDLQPRLGDPALVRLVNELRLAGHLGPGALRELMGRSVRIDRLLGDRDREPGTARPTRSQLEDLFVVFTVRLDLPLPEINARLPENGREVDALYRRARLIIEIDSWRHHSDRASFERDRAKDAAALALGYRTLRITLDRMRHHGDAEAEIIRRILDI